MGNKPVNNSEPANKVAVVIVTCNSWSYLQRCLASLEAGTKADFYEIFLVDNASSDETPVAFPRLYPRAWFRRSEINLGFSRGVNLALRQVLAEKKHDWVLLLNPDVEIKNQALEKMRRFLEKNPEAAGVGPSLLLPDGNYQDGAAGFFPTQGRAAAYFLGLSLIFPGLIKSFFLNPRAWIGKLNAVEVDWLCGACLLLRREALERVGLFDERYFFAVEDVEWGWRVRKCGLKLFYLPAVEVLHYQGGSREKVPGHLTDWVVNILDLVSRERGKAESFLVRWWAMAGFALRFFAWGIVFLFSWKEKDRLRAKEKQKINLRFFQATLFPARHARLK